MRCALLLFVLYAETLFAAADAGNPAEETANMLPNPSFEKVDGGEPEGWRFYKWEGSCEHAVAAEGHTGKRSVKMWSTKGDMSWFLILDVTPYSTYRLSAWIKTEEVVPLGGMGALLTVTAKATYHSRALTGTNGWTKVSHVFENGASSQMRLNLCLGGWGAVSGTAWFDDVCLERLPAAELKRSLVIDTAEERSPISPHIFGQFLQHAGSCIYNGIWAELLKDRKFFFDAGSAQSPWKTTGDSGVITMITEGGFAGRKTLQITGGGDTPPEVYQDAVPLKKDTKYTGRIVLAGEASAAPVAVTLSWGSEENDRQTIPIDSCSKGYTPIELSFTAKKTTSNGRFSIQVTGKGSVKVGAVSLMPADNVNGMRRDTLALLKELKAPLYKWPGGNFVSGYNWLDGIGERDKRPTKPNPAWDGLEPNDFGMDEFLLLCKEIGAEPYVVVNSGLGTAIKAAQQVEYANGGKETVMGKLRAQNGHPDPYGVTWWGIGNEMFGSWQLGHVPIEAYIPRHRAFGEAMRASDSSVKLVGVGSIGVWSKRMISECSDTMDLISQHFYCEEDNYLYPHVIQMPRSIASICRSHRRYLDTIDATNRKVPLALDEWNYWYGEEKNGELDTTMHLQDALGVAEALHECFRHSDLIKMANHAHTVNSLGCIKTNPDDAVFTPTGLVFKLFSNHYGRFPVATGGSLAPLDAQAAWSEDRKSIACSLVNPSDAPISTAISVKGARAQGAATLWTITGPDKKAFNEPGSEPGVTLSQKTLTDPPETLDIPPVSVCLLILPAEKPPEKTSDTGTPSN